MVFYGEYQQSLTDGGRIAIPKKIRSSISAHNAKKCVLTKGYDGCIAGYSPEDWERRSQHLLDVSLLDKEHIEKRRMLFSGAHELSMDDQGRIVLPKSLTDYMKLEDGTVTIIGVGDHFEIWDTKRWTQYSNDQAM